MTTTEDVSDGPMTYPKGTPRQRQIAADAIREARKHGQHGGAAFGFASEVLARRAARWLTTTDLEHAVDLGHAFVLMDNELRTSIRRSLR